MIDLPKDLTDGLFDSKLERGSVVRTLFRCSNQKEKYKYFVILNKDLSSDSLIFVLTTSQLEFYAKYPHFNKDIVRIQSSVVDFFPKETIINCREVHQIPKEKLKVNFQNGTLEFAGNLPSNILAEVDAIIKQSFYISKDNKKLILG